MSNVHRIGDYATGPNNQAFPATGRNGQQIPQQGQMPQGGGGGMGMFMGGGGGGGPRYPPINKVLAPNFSPRTFIFIITIIQILMFITELIYGQIVYGVAFDPDNDMAGPSGSTMLDLGGKYLPCIQSGEIFRFITPAILHSGILHIFTNLVSQTMIGYTCELRWGTLRIAVFYFSTAFGATLLSCVGSPCNISVGASGALLGIIGCYMAWILLNWNNSALLAQPCQRMCGMIWWLIIIAMIGASSPGIDNLAHLGGFISGILIGLAFNQHSDPIEWMTKCGSIRVVKIVCAALTGIYFISLLLSTFFAVECAGKSCF